MSTFADVLAEHHTHIEQVVLRLAHHHYLSADEIVELRARVQRVLERNNYEQLRHYEARSTWETYLTTVITRTFFEFQAELWGTWRPSSRAKRLGAAAVLLEELVARDGLAFDDAIAIMRSNHRVDVPQARLDEFRHVLGLDVPTDEPSPEADARKRAIDRAIRDAFAILSPDDRLLLTLRYRDHEPVTQIARLLKDDPRPLQRRIDQVKDVIKTTLTTQGIPASEVEAILRNADADVTLRSGRKRWWHAVLSRPSKQ